MHSLRNASSSTMAPPLTPLCDTFMTPLDAADKVALGVDVDFIDKFDSNLFDVSFEGTLSFYSDDQFAVAVDGDSDPFAIGQDTIFGKVTVAMADPTIDCQFSGVTIETGYAEPGADLTVDSVSGLGGCLSTNIDADGPYNLIGAGAVAIVCALRSPPRRRTRRDSRS